ncbi:MAG TPA: hypothetical protein VHV79_13535 [Mycobacteriales bacterium]|jgi:hypothetical protein|nr:hypothetical protein [Mycobacteriales bacterium]
MPQFLVGNAPHYDANWDNEQREFGLPRMFYSNIFAPPLPQPKRFIELGRLIRELVESWPSQLRVAIIGTGHLSLELVRAEAVRPARPRPRVRCESGRVDQDRRHRTGARPVTLESLWTPGNATHRFMDFMLMMGVAGEGVAADYSDSLDLPHHGGLLHLVSGGVPMSRYLLDKFLFMIDRDPELVEPYRAEPAETVAWWEAEQANQVINCHAAEQSTWLAFTDGERAALSSHDLPALYGMGAHPFLTLTLFIAMFERDYAEPLGFQFRRCRMSRGARRRRSHRR